MKIVLLLLALCLVLMSTSVTAAVGLRSRDRMDDELASKDFGPKSPKVGKARPMSAAEREAELEEEEEEDEMEMEMEREKEMKSKPAPGEVADPDDDEDEDDAMAIPTWNEVKDFFENLMPEDGEEMDEDEEDALKSEERDQDQLEEVNTDSGERRLYTVATAGGLLTTRARAFNAFPETRRCASGIPFAFAPYGCCPGRNTLVAASPLLSNCPRVTCANAPHGCCAGSSVFKVNRLGSNCPGFFDTCRQSSFGCCPGTRILCRDRIASNCRFRKAIVAIAPRPRVAAATRTTTTVVAGTTAFPRIAPRVVSVGRFAPVCPRRCVRANGCCAGTAIARVNRFGVNCRLNDPCRFSRFGCCPRPRARAVYAVRRTVTTTVLATPRPRALCTNRLCSNCGATLATNSALLDARTIAGPLARPVDIAGGVFGPNYFGGAAAFGPGYYGGGVLNTPGYFGAAGVPAGVFGPGYFGGDVAAPLVY